MNNRQNIEEQGQYRRVGPLVPLSVAWLIDTAGDGTRLNSSRKRLVCLGLHSGPRHDDNEDGGEHDPGMVEVLISIGRNRFPQA